MQFVNKLKKQKTNQNPLEDSKSEACTEVVA